MVSGYLVLAIGSAPLWTLLGVAFGAAASVFAWRYIVWATEPQLELDSVPDSAEPQRGEQHPSGPHRFYHVLVRHRPARFPFNSRSPAWAARATLELFDSAGASVLTPRVIDARWPNQPEPVKDVLRNGNAENLFDPTLIFVGKRDDVHFHESRTDRVWINVAVKFEGDPGFFLFTNESYFQNWCKPEWHFTASAYQLTVRIYYETGVTERRFTLANTGTSRDGLTIKPTRSGRRGH